MLISDLTFIFGIIAAFTESTINFVIPGALFIYSAKIAGKRNTIIETIWALLYIVMGVSYFFISNYFNYLKLYGQFKEGI